MNPNGVVPPLVDRAALAHHETAAALPDVFSVGEVARAAGVHRSDVRELLDSGRLTTVNGRFLSCSVAIHAVRRLSREPRLSDRTLFKPAWGMERRTRSMLALSGTLHAAVAVLLVFVGAMGFARPAPESSAPTRPEMRLVFLTTPGPGGGGGGGGKRNPVPPPAAERKGVSTMRSPLPIRKPPPRVDPPPVVRPSVPPPVEMEPLPPIVAPVVPVAADTRDRPGVPVDASRDAESHGPGKGGGTGTGQGTGVGEGTGPGIGPGSGGGTGGGPYRPGSGIAPPSLLHEVKPDYTEEARRRSVEGDVVLEIVVRRDGSVGDLKVLQGLGSGLDQRATEAVRQWRFAPAQRQGIPVDVIVEVAVEFKLR